MSAWLVEREHIDVLMAYGLSDPANKLYWRIDGDQPFAAENVRELTYETATAIGAMLWQENVASLCFRYESDTAEMYGQVFEYAYRDPHYVLSHREALQAVACLEYQSCEHDGWESSEAKRCLDAIQGRAISKLYEGPWGWDKDALAAKPKQISLYGMTRKS